MVAFRGKILLAIYGSHSGPLACPAVWRLSAFWRVRYGRFHCIRSLESFDPRPETMRNTSSDRVPTLLQDVKGKGLCVSLLLDASVRVDVPEETTVLTKTELLEKVINFKKQLEVSEEEVRRIEIATRGQSKSPQWFEARRFRLTASLFGRVKQLKPSTPPDNLVLTILGVKKASGVPSDYGQSMEATALDAYIKHQQANGHPDIYATVSGVIISSTHALLQTLVCMTLRTLIHLALQ